MAARKKASKKNGPGDKLIGSMGQESRPSGWSLSLGASGGGSKKGYGGGFGGEVSIPLFNRKKTSVTGSLGFEGGAFKNKGGSKGSYISASPGVTITRTFGTKKKKRKQP